MSEQHARLPQAGSGQTAAPVGLAGWPFPLADGDDDLHEQLEGYRRRMRAAIDANEALIRGMGSAAQRSLNLLQSVVDGTREDLARAMRAEQPEASARVQFDAFHERSREFLDGMRSVADDVYECWFTAMGAAWAAPAAGEAAGEDAEEEVVRLGATEAARTPAEAGTAPPAANEPGTRARHRA